MSMRMTSAPRQDPKKRDLPVSMSGEVNVINQLPRMQIPKKKIRIVKIVLFM